MSCFGIVLFRCAPDDKFVQLEGDQRHDAGRACDGWDNEPVEIVEDGSGQHLAQLSRFS